MFIWLPAVCWWYLCFFTLPKHLEVLQNLLNGRHATMSFTIENEMQNRMSFFDVQIIWHYRYLPLPSTVNPPLVEFIHILTPFYHLSISLVMFTHAYRSFRICYPQNVINICPKRFMDNLYVVKETTLTVEKKSFVLVLTYVVLISLETRIKLKKSLWNILYCSKMRIAFINKTRLGNNFHFKDQIPKGLSSGYISVSVYSVIMVNALETWM